MNEKIKAWCDKNGVKVKELAEVANISEKSVYNFFNGSEIKSGAIKRWAQVWPEMICYALELKCNNQETVMSEKDVLEKISDVIKRLGALEEKVR